jgi:serine/threonine-protein kinase PknK
MLDTGRTNQQIAHSLTVTVNTVKWYLKNIYAKLGATNRSEAVSTARRSGLLT